MHVGIIMVLGSAVVPAYCKARYTVLIYYFMYYASLFKIVKDAVQGNTVDLTQYRFQLGMAQRQPIVTKGVEYLDSGRGYF